MCCLLCRNSDLDYISFPVFMPTKLYFPFPPLAFLIVPCPYYTALISIPISTPLNYNGPLYIMTVDIQHKKCNHQYGMSKLDNRMIWGIVPCSHEHSHTSKLDYPSVASLEHCTFNL